MVSASIPSDCWAFEDLCARRVWMIALIFFVLALIRIPFLVCERTN